MFTFKDPLNRSNNYSLSEIALKSGFKFRDIENRRLDWKTLGCVDVNKVIENQDYEFLEKITPKIIEAPMQSILGTAAIDPAVSSLFRLAQMSLQYMSFCQQFMSHTLYDLRTAFNHTQKKYSNLKYNYKCLEEQHYKAQERIQFLLREIKNQQDMKGSQSMKFNSKPSSLYPCDQCTKNFLTSESLKSHQQRKHSDIEEKHELSDDNEKQNGHLDKQVSMDELEPNQEEMLMPVDEDSHQSIIINNNNNNNESNGNCTECCEKSKISSSSVAIQCEVNILQNGNIGPQKSHDVDWKVIDEKTKKEENDTSTYAKKIDNDSVQNAHDTIGELKKEIVELKSLLEAKTNVEISQASPESILDAKDVHLLHTSDKIDVIEQKFNAFETMYMDSFIESFRNLDERQKIYMDNIQETIKEIVEKSLVQHETTTNDAIAHNENDSPNISEMDKSIDIENHKEIYLKSTEDTYQEREDEQIIEASIDSQKTTDHFADKIIEPQRVEQKIVHDSSSSSKDEHEKLVFQAEVHRLSQDESSSSDHGNELMKNPKISKKRISKKNAINEFELRLRQLGVDAESIGIASPRSHEVNQDLSEEREEMKKVHKSFEVTRRKLKCEVNRIAKEKLVSANSMTSLSSTSYLSEDQILYGEQKMPLKKMRPKSASVQKMRKRSAKKLMNRFVENDIDENDIIDKMQMAQKAINSHRECIQQLLQTTAHSPSSLTKIKYSLPIEEKKTDENGEINGTGMNQYNKMPNVTTRRVVFVNLDEDS